MDPADRELLRELWQWSRHNHEHLLKISIRLDEIQSALAKIPSTGALGDDIMHSIQELAQDIKDLNVTIPAYIAGRDTIDATLNQTIKDLTAQHASDAITLADMQAGIDAAFTDAEAAKAKLQPPAPATDPNNIPSTGGTGATGDTGGATGATGATGAVDPGAAGGDGTDTPAPTP